MLHRWGLWCRGRGGSGGREGGRSGGREGGRRGRRIMYGNYVEEREGRYREGGEREKDGGRRGRKEKEESMKVRGREGLGKGRVKEEGKR